MWICSSTSKQVSKSLFWLLLKGNCAVYNISSYLTSCFQEVCDLRHGHKVSHMGLACSCCPPVNFKFPLLQYLLQLLFPENLLQWKQKSRFNGSVPPHSTNNLRYADYTTLTAEGKEELKNLLMKVKESEKAGLKLNIQKTKIMASGPTTSWQIRWGEKCKQWQTLFPWAPKSLQWLQPWS